MKQVAWPSPKQLRVCSKWCEVVCLDNWDNVFLWNIFILVWLIRLISLVLIAMLYWIVSVRIQVIVLRGSEYVCLSSLNLIKYKLPILRRLWTVWLCPERQICELKCYWHPNNRSSTVTKFSTFLRSFLGFFFSVFLCWFSSMGWWLFRLLSSTFLDFGCYRVDSRWLFWSLSLYLFSFPYWFFITSFALANCWYWVKFGWGFGWQPVGGLWVDANVLFSQLVGLEKAFDGFFVLRLYAFII